MTSPAPHPQLCRKPALALAFSSLNQRTLNLSSVSRWFHFALYVSKQNSHCFQRVPMTVNPSRAMPSSAPLVSLLCSGSLSLEVVLRVSFAPSPWLALLQPWGQLAVALHRPADAWNLWSGTLCFNFRHHQHTVVLSPVMQAECKAACQFEFHRPHSSARVCPCSWAAIAISDLWLRAAVSPCH